MHALNHLVKIRMDLSMGSCGKDPIEELSLINSEIFVGILVKIKHSCTPDMVV